MRVLNEPQIRAFLESAETDYDVRVPVALHDGTRSLGKLGDGPLALAGGAILQKVTSVFFPQMETILTSSQAGIQAPTGPARPLFVVGFTAADADCLAFVDRFFSDGYRDDIYCNKRENAVVVCVSGKCGARGDFLKIAGGKCDLELIADDQDYLLVDYSEKGKALVAGAGGQPASASKLRELQQQSDRLGTDDFDLLRKASRLLIDGRVPEEFWDEVSDRCIACTSCNLTCPTCTCFDMFDRKAGDDRTERWRLWDSCQLDGFMREASGHNPMGREGVRTRRRIHHKLAADVTRRGEISCMLCGRCDAVCPTGIGIKAVCQEMVEKYG